MQFTYSLPFSILSLLYLGLSIVDYKKLKSRFPTEMEIKEIIRVVAPFFISTSLCSTSVFTATILYFLAENIVEAGGIQISGIIKVIFMYVIITAIYFYALWKRDSFVKTK